MKHKILLSLVAVLLTTALSAQDYDFQSGDWYYTITSDNTVAVGYCGYLTTVIIPETVTYNGTTYSVTSIGDDAFAYCSSLTSITIPNSVTSIGRYAFEYCSSLTSITLPNSVTSIGDYAFEYCSSLTSITIPNSVTSIGDYAFYGCTSLPVEDNLRYADSYLVGAVDESLSTYTIKAGTKWIGNVAFAYCSSLTSITLPNSVTSIGRFAFEYCSSLTSITIPNSVTSIGDYAFRGCTSLTSITIPNSVTSIGDRAFYGCTSLPVDDNLRYADSYLVEAVDNSLSTYTIKAGTKWIGDDAFAYCSSLTSLTLPNSVTSIGFTAFEGCSSLTSITIPNSVTSIGKAAFWNCSSLADIYCYATTPPVCYNDNTFYGVSKHCYIHVPAGTIRDYQLAPGWRYFSNFFEISEETAISETEQQNKSSRKIIRDGQVLILRNGVTYDMMGNRRASL